MTVPSVFLMVGDAETRMRELPDRSVHCCVTSPPYYGLRNYGNETEVGREKTPKEYVERLVSAFREVRRTLRDDGSLWVVIGDCYSASPPGNKTVGVSAMSTLNGVNGESGSYRDRLARGPERDLHREGIRARRRRAIPPVAGAEGSRLTLLPNFGKR